MDTANGGAKVLKTSRGMAVSRRGTGAGPQGLLTVHRRYSAA